MVAVHLDHPIEAGHPLLNRLVIKRVKLLLIKLDEGAPLVPFAIKASEVLMSGLIVGVELQKSAPRLNRLVAVTEVVLGDLGHLNADLELLGVVLLSALLSEQSIEELTPVLLLLVIINIEVEHEGVARVVELDALKVLLSLSVIDHLAPQDHGDLKEHLAFIFTAATHTKRGVIHTHQLTPRLLLVVIAHTEGD